MKNHSFFWLIVCLFIFGSCNSKKKSDEVASYSYVEEKVEMSNKLKAIIPGWVKEGMVCYSLVVLVDKDDNPLIGKPVKAKVVQIGENTVKMKALETVYISKIEGCVKNGILKGETWDEKLGDFYLTEGDAIQALLDKNLLQAAQESNIN